MTDRMRQLWRTVVLASALLIASMSVAWAVMLVELKLDATARPYGPNAPVNQISQEFSVPSGPGTVTITYTEETYVGGPGGFSYEPKDLSNEYLGWGGSIEYKPRDPARGQRYQVVITLRRDFSKKVWVARLVARHEYQAFQIRHQGRQLASTQTLFVEFVPGGPADAAGKPATTSGSTPGSTPGTAAPVAATPPAPPPSAAPPAPQPPPAPAPTPPVATTPVAPPPVAAPPVSVPPPTRPTGLPPGSDTYDSTSKITGDPFDGGVWSNARNGSAAASRTFAAPVCIAGVQVDSAGTDVDTTGSLIEITLTGPSGGRFVALQMLDSAINRGFSPGGRAQVAAPPQTRTFAPVPTQRVDLIMRGHGWFLVSGLRFMVVACP